MTNELHPRDEADVVAAVEAALASERPMAVVGAATKAGYGRPIETSAVLRTGGLSGVRMYEAEELVMTAGAGTPVREVVALLDQQGQQLAFEPLDPSALYGGEVGGGTIGGIFATNLSGSRRLTAGAARDHLLGFRAVSGRGEIFKSGGRVMKNVTGYDLSKLVCGSNGTLAVLTEVTFKVLPKPETERTLLVTGLSEDAALKALRVASGSPNEVSSLAYVPAGVRVSGVDAAAALRLEGPEVSVAARADALTKLLSGGGAAFQALDGAASSGLWSALRDGVPVAGGSAIVWRISVAPTEGGRVAAAIVSAGVPVVSRYHDWAGGLVWLAVDAAASDAGATAIRTAVDAVGGHATLMRAPDAVRREIPVFQPQPGPLAALTRRVKAAFDPEGILNPGRMSADA